jgi:hypothetical protein
VLTAITKVCAYFSIHCFFAKQKSKRMVRTGGEVMGGIASARLEDVRCQVSGVTGNHVLNSSHNKVPVTSHIS